MKVNIKGIVFLTLNHSKRYGISEAKRVAIYCEFIECVKSEMYDNHKRWRELGICCFLYSV